MAKLLNIKFIKKLIALSGPGFLVAVGYMDPGNWATDIAGGSQFGYQLLSVILISNVMAMILQHLAIKLGITTNQDLAEACKKNYSLTTSFFLWILAEIAIIACDLAEIIGAAIAIQLLFGLPIIIGVLITSLDVLLLLLLQKKNTNTIEIIVFSLVFIIFVSFLFEMYVSKPDFHLIVRNLIPTKNIFQNKEMLYLAIGILGATVMPHNLYLHSALVKDKVIKSKGKRKGEFIKLLTTNSNIALFIASIVNASILIVASATFNRYGHFYVSEIQDAYKLLTPILGNSLAPIVFAIALLASGHSSTITGTIAGQVVMEGFVNIKIPAWKRRIITRFSAIIPAIICIAIYGEHSLTKLLILSQVVLSLQLPFAVIPLVKFTSSKKIMRKFANTQTLNFISVIIAAVIITLNLILVTQVFA